MLEHVKRHPGSHLRQIKRELGLSMGVAQYHLYTLEKERKIISRRGGLYKRFYPSLTFGENQQEILDVLSQETERDLLLYLLQNPKATQKELAEYAQISAGTASWHMKRLASTGLITPTREGQFVRYTVNGDAKEILNLLRGYHPSVWANWVDRFANALTEVTLSSTAELTQIAPSKEEGKQEKLE